MRQILVIISMLFIPIVSLAQEIKGNVVDEFGTPLSGVTIQVLETEKYSITDFDGNFTIEAKEGQDLKFTMIGMEDLVAKATTNMNVVMKESLTELDDVVMIGYGRAKKRDLTGSIVSVKGEEVADKPNNNVLTSLQGKVAGLTVVNSGQPGQEPDVRIRGTISLYQTKPLYVVDGIFTDNIDFVNPNDIASIEVLKDPSSLSVFGARGANGVIVVTTKRAKNGETVINYNSSVGFKSITGKPSMTNAQEFKYLYDMQRQNQGVAPYSYYDLYTADTDWVDAISNDNALFYNHNISFSNSSENNKFYAGFGYSNEEGLIKNELYKKFTANLNDELNIKKNLKLGFNINFLDARLPRLGSFTSALNSTPIVSPYNEELGVYNQLPTEMGGAQLGNALLEVEGKKGTQLNRDTRFVGNVFAELKFLQHFTLRGAYLADLDFNKGRGYLPVFNVYAAESDDLTAYSGNVLTKVNQYSNYKQNLQQDYTLSYENSFGLHNVTLLAGHTRYEEYYSAMSGTVSQYAPSYDENGVDVNQIPNDPRWWYLNVFPYGDPTTRFSNSNQWDRATLSYLGRVLYNYDGKYMLNASFRRDDSSELRNAQNFWAVGAAWEISKEKFFNVKHINYLKLKGSMGEQGNQFTTLHYPTYPLYVPGQSAVFGEELVPAYILAYRINPDLEWETVLSKEIGLEIGAFDNRLSFEANYYDKRTKGLLAYITGTDNFYGNVGEVKNNGLEFIASWKNEVREGFSYSVSANLTTMNNKVVSLYDEGFDYFTSPTRTIAGQPISSFYGYVVEGVYQTYADILNSPISTLGDYTVGDLKYKDINGDGVINTDDRTYIGNPTPDFTYGFSVNVNYNKWSLGVDFQGVYGNEVYRNWGNGSSYAQFNYRSDRLGAWTGPGTSNWEPRVYDASGYNSLPSTYMIEDGSYLRLRNVQLAYNFDSKFLSAAKIKSLRLFLNAQNFVTWKKNSGFTPEFGGSPTYFGVDGGSYPVPAITTLGLNVTF
ncbi:TonB-dependent receptor [Flavobacterium sp. NRK F10]|uniref:SusC/RagA family TonB-linked outer membrane protein n=1 Tax=Flavobacterium sp. NRK F10 TaxID=2954931 RepID=UPI002091B58B|nr:TonB-dependent receptor [Flavobacterium sp. NRK F10]MCO6175791.1 TonB-dependent receptor [Flavobacterium sp. NRK F10]